MHGSFICMCICAPSTCLVTLWPPWSLELNLQIAVRCHRVVTTRIWVFENVLCAFKYWAISLPVISNFKYTYVFIVKLDVLVFAAYIFNWNLKYFLAWLLTVSVEYSIFFLKDLIWSLTCYILSSQFFCISPLHCLT